MSVPSDACSFNTAAYQRPNQDWECGHLANGCPCPIGPNGHGDCQVDQICIPLKNDAGWTCGRAAAWGGRCNEGPVPDATAPDQRATCPHAAPPCQPRRSLRSQRRLISGVVVAASLGLCLLMLGGSSSSTGTPLLNTQAMISPGDLTAYHSTIQQGCGACHSTVEASPGSLLNRVFTSTGSIEESRKCLNCHQSALGDHGLQPHGVDADRLADLTAQAAAKPAGVVNTLRQRLARLGPGHKVTADGEMACAICHQEHRGREFDLKHITNQQCQICHTGSFHSLQTGHPDFAIPEREQPANLSFDHQTHYQVHFADDGGTWLAESTDSCLQCHVPDEANRSMTVARFDQSCAACHLDQIEADKVESLRLPGVPLLTVATSDFMPEPTEAFGAELSEPPIMRLLLQADPDYVDAKNRLGTSPQEPSPEALAAVATAREQLVSDLLSRRRAAFVQRLNAVLAADLSGDVHAAAEALEQSGFFTVLSDIQEQVNATQAPRLISPAWEVRTSATATESISLVYHCQSHADDVLHTWLDLAAAAATTAPAALSGSSESIEDILFATLTQPQTTGRCSKCHTVSRADGHFIVNWAQTPSQTGGFTKFSHSPHVTLLSQQGQVRSVDPFGDRRCEACHHIKRDDLNFQHAGSLLTGGNPPADAAHRFFNSVQPMSRSECVTCHTSDAAGNGCLQCHNYHVH